jgi:hypothetical protein
VLASFKKGSKIDDEADDDSIESAVKKSTTGPEPKQMPAQRRGSSYVKWRIVVQTSDPVEER